MPAKKYPLELIQRASQITGKTEDTIRRWAKSGLNLFNESEVLAWNKKKGNLRTPEKIINVTPKTETKPPRRKPNSAELAILDSLPAPTEEGAAAALKRLHGLEQIFYSRLVDALSNPAEPQYIGVANSEYQKICEAMRKYEAAVEETRRDLGHLIPKKEAQDGARSAALWFRLAWRLWLSSSLPDLLAIKDPRTAKGKAEESFSEILLVSFKNASEAKLSIPDWALSAITEEFHINE